MVEYDPQQRRAALKRFMNRNGLTVNGWASASKLSEGTLRNFLKGESDSMTDKSWQKLAHGAKVTVADILGTEINNSVEKIDFSLVKTETPEKEVGTPPAIGLEFAPLGRGHPSFVDTRIPILGVASGGNRGDFILTETVASYALRPAALANVSDVYGILIRGESMIPRWFPNEPVFASSVKEARPGDFVIVQLRGKDGDLEGLVKLMVRKTDKEITLQALNPPDSRPFKIQMSEIETIHRVYTHAELHGV